MNWRKASSSIRRVLAFPNFIFVFISCANASVGLLYIQQDIQWGAQYMPVAAAAAYFVSRLLYAFEKGLKISRNEILGYAFIISTAVSLALQTSLGVDATDTEGISALDYTTGMWTFNMLYFFAGAACIPARYRKSDIIAIILVLLVLIPFLAAPKQVIFLDYWEMRQRLQFNSFTHLNISEWCVFILISAFAFASDRLRPIILVVTFVVLFGLQGRSSTVFTPFSMLVFWVLTGGKRVIFIYGCIAVIAVGVFVLTPVSDLLMDSNESALERMLISEDDSSLEGRRAIFEESLQNLPKSILYGDPTYIAVEAGRMGSYIHNLLSMWQFFGLIPFVLIIIVLIRSLLVMRRRLMIGNLSVMEEIACMLLIYVAISVVLAKSVVFYWLWFAAGYWILQYSGSNRKVRLGSGSANRKPWYKNLRRSKRRSKGKSGRSPVVGGARW